MRDRLLRAGFEAAEVEDELARLESVALLDDERFAEEFAEHAVASRRAGRRAIVTSLAAKGIARDTIERVVARVDVDEEARALELARTRAARLRGLEPGVAFRRLASFLLRRGYDGEVARRAARAALEIDPTEP
ncbi:MAG: RecX family transcriptional regulator [Actinobacteria bacterium]|nr:RecX family transcriptional regulator [Actinomycetota bacterium]